MKTTIIGHNINIIGLDDIDLTAENDSFIYDINDSILAGNFTGRIEIDGKFYEWEVEESISPEEIENLTYANKKMGDFLEKLGFSSDEITSYIINGSKEESEEMLKRARTSNINSTNILQETTSNNELKTNEKVDSEIDDYLQTLLSNEDLSIENAYNLYFEKMLEGTGYTACFVETTELYGEDDPNIDEDDPYYMEPMYEAHIEDENENELDDSWTGRYCEHKDVAAELEAYINDKLCSHMPFFN